jgi:hypothetical protein
MRGKVKKTRSFTGIKKVSPRNVLERISPRKNDLEEEEDVVEKKVTIPRVKSAFFPRRKTSLDPEPSSPRRMMNSILSPRKRNKKRKETSSTFQEETSSDEDSSFDWEIGESGSTEGSGKLLRKTCVVETPSSPRYIPKAMSYGGGLMEKIVVPHNEADELLRALRAAKDVKKHKDPIEEWLDEESLEKHKDSIEEWLAEESSKSESASLYSSENPIEEWLPEESSTLEPTYEELGRCLKSERRVVYKDGKTYANLSGQWVRANHVMLIKSHRCVVISDNPTLIDCTNCEVVGNKAYLFRCARTKVRGDFYCIRQCEDIRVFGHSWNQTEGVIG